MEIPAILFPCCAVAWEDSKCSFCLSVGDSGVGGDARCRMVGVLTLPSTLSNYAMGKEASTLSSRSSVFPKSCSFIEAQGMLSIAKVPLSMSSCRCSAS